MNYKVKGTITKIEEVKELSNGAKVLNYIVEQKEVSGNGLEWVTPFNINMYKAGEYLGHIDKFLEFNKVGDEVEVEFTIRGQEYQGKIYNSLSHWRCEKTETIKSEQPKQAEDQDNDLPF